jgi:hypothetical protein
MPKSSLDECQCLPCTLRRTLATWKAAHFLSTEGLVDQLGVFVIREISRQPEFQGRTIGVALLETHEDGSTERLH